jgi:hypothetical protein
VVRIAQIAFADWAQPTKEGLSGLLSTESNMDQFVRSQNVARYRRLLERVSEESDRQTIIKLLAEEQHKQKVAGDPAW